MKKLTTCTALALLVLVPALALAAEGGKKGKGKAAEPEAPPPKAAEEMELIQKGHASLLIRDYGKALDTYKLAAEKAPKSPAIHYYIATALKLKGDLDQAVESYRTAYLRATGEEEGWKGPSLVGVALACETGAKWEDAKKAWQDYVSWAAGKTPKPDLTLVAKKRIEAIDAMLEMETLYAPVRELIKNPKTE